MSDIVLDCESGKQMGCAAFCCRLLVRLQPGEKEPGGNNHPLKSCVDKIPHSGLCIYYSEQKQQCTVWDRRPQTCREYNCNEDPRLNMVLAEGYRGLVHLAKRVSELLTSNDSTRRNARVRVPIVK